MRQLPAVEAHPGGRARAHRPVPPRRAHRRLPRHGARLRAVPVPRGRHPVRAAARAGAPPRARARADRGRAPRPGPRRGRAGARDHVLRPPARGADRHDARGVRPGHPRGAARGRARPARAQVGRRHGGAEARRSRHRAQGDPARQPVPQDRDDPGPAAGAGAEGQRERQADRHREGRAAAVRDPLLRLAHDVQRPVQGREGPLRRRQGLSGPALTARGW
ncbi:LigA [Anaeromyxobacter dehalogenans 2CP-C]|uniref:LigA n=1 Tax=Anaeromyxobacter dehalogenans (strain 2CP-C) TaxID=290397 RepID=Q2II05_ANADE|nr:LigA [Anaeromyxobacter dehalogenans 2CP-C]